MVKNRATEGNQVNGRLWGISICGKKTVICGIEDILIINGICKKQLMQSHYLWEKGCYLWN
jgi:hypothetical protein